MSRWKMAGCLAGGGIVAPIWVGQARSKEDGGGGRRGRRGGDRADRGDRGEGGRRFDMEAMRERMQKRMQKSLGATDEEWKVIGPKLEKVTQLSRGSRGMGMGMMFRGRRGGDRRGGEAGEGRARPEPSAVQKATTELRKTLDNKDANAADLKAKVAALRAARVKAKAELAKAQKELQKVVNPRQEALLVLRGLLD
ncbi:MAG: hypothetical protein QGD94_08875 [Planctomycetia bacterium]|nr:hypothetical protein [Planctomycetia bacterium]